MTAITLERVLRMRLTACLITGFVALSGCGGGGGGSAAPTSVQPLAPTVTITAPVGGEKLSQAAAPTITASAADADGNVTQVEFFADGVSIGVDTSSPYSIVWNATVGTFDLTATATDDDGQRTTSSARSVEVLVSFAPVLSLKGLTEDDVYVGPTDITLGVDASDEDGEVDVVTFFANGELIATDTTEPFEIIWRNPDEAQYALSIVAVDDLGVETTTEVDISLVSQAPFVVDDQQMGDPDTCYGNPEFTRDNQYMTWFEPMNRIDNGRQVVQMWHCGIDQETGDFIPPDCRGFAGFESNLPERAYNGINANGSLYVGGNNDHQFVMVQPTGPTSGEVTLIGGLPDTERRAIYPSQVPGSEKVWVYWLKSHGPDLSPGNAEWVELRYIDIDEPENEILIERQDRPTVQWAPMDLTFPRWSWDEPIIIYGTRVDSGAIEVVQLNVSDADPQPQFITNDSNTKTGQFPIIYEGDRYIVSSLNSGTQNTLFRAPESGEIFDTVDAWSPPLNRTFPDPCTAVSNEPFEFDGRLFTTYQVNRCGDEIDIFFSNTGEIWLTELLDGSSESWRLTQASSDVKIEPEPLVINGKAFVYYTRYAEGLDQSNACFQVHRAATPLNQS